MISAQMASSAARAFAPGDAVTVGVEPSGVLVVEAAVQAPRSRASRSAVVSRRTSSRVRPWCTAMIGGRADHVVVRRHAVLVCAGARDREQVAGVDVGGQFDVAGDLVTGFAVPSGYGDDLRRAELVPVGKCHRVFRAVERDARVVGHAAIHATNVRPPGCDLTDDHPVQRDACAGTDRPSGSTTSAAAGTARPHTPGPARRR